MNNRNLRQIDILNLLKPYCQMYNIKFNKSDISQYLSGKSNPNQAKLYILSKALNVNVAWLMGYDVPVDNIPNNILQLNNIIDEKYGKYSNDVLKVFSRLDNIDKLKILERIEVLLEDDKYK